MKLQITNQTNEQECGICVITSLHNYFYNDGLPKEQVLDKSNVGTTGMTIFDFETLATKAGVECESYEVQWSEFLNLHINNYFVALVATKDGQSNHYVIVQKLKRRMVVYDSCSFDKKELSYEQFKNIFLNVIILVSKKPNKLFSKIFSNTKTILLFDIKFVLLNLFLSILILGSSILGASFLNWIIDSAISKNSINNLITISFIFVFVYFSNDLLTYITDLYVSNQMKNYYLLFTNKILSGIEYKRPDFLNKVDKNWIFKVDECVANISNFCVLEINKLITNLIFSFICICIVGSMQPYMLIFSVVFVLIEFIPFLFSYRKKKELFTRLVRTENKNTQYYKRLIQSICFETWQDKKKNLICNIKNNYSRIYKNFNDVTLFRTNNALAKSLIKSLAEILLIAVASYLIIKNNSLSIGKLTFIIAAFSLYRNSLNEIFNYFLSKIEFEVYWQVYKDITDVSNLSDQEILKEEITEINFILNNVRYKIDTTKKINIVNTSIHSLFCECQTIKFNNKIVDKDSKSLHDKLIILDQHSTINLEMFIEMMEENPNLYSKYLRHFNIDINQEPISFYNQIIINLLSLLNVKNKVIVIDSVTPYVKNIDKIVVKEIINTIRKNNSVFVVGKENND